MRRSSSICCSRPLARPVPATCICIQRAQGLLVQWRIDGVLQPLGEFPRGKAADVVARLKVLAELLTYRTDMPQEGRIRRDRGALPP